MSLNRRSNLGGTERLAAPLLLGARLEQRLRQQVTGGGDRVRVGRNTFFPRTSDLGSSASPDQHLRVADSRYLDDSSSNNRPDSGLPGEPHASWLHGRSEIRTGRSSGLLRPGYLWLRRADELDRGCPSLQFRPSIQGGTDSDRCHLRALGSRRVGDPHRRVESSLGEAALVARLDAPRRSFRAGGPGIIVDAPPFPVRGDRLHGLEPSFSGERIRRSGTELSQPERVLINGTLGEFACPALHRLGSFLEAPGHVGVGDTRRAWDQACDEARTRRPSGPVGVCPSVDSVADHRRKVRGVIERPSCHERRQGLFHVETVRLGVSDSCEQWAVGRALADPLEAFSSES